MDRDTSCNTIQGLLALHYYGELDTADAEAVTSHIAACGDCRDEYHSLSITLDSVPSYEPSELDVRRAVVKVRRELSGRKRSGLARRFAPAFGLAAALAFVVVALFSHWSPITHNQPQQQVVVAQADWDTLNNMDVLPDIDVIEDMDTIDMMENM